MDIDFLFKIKDFSIYKWFRETDSFLIDVEKMAILADKRCAQDPIRGVAVAFVDAVHTENAFSIAIGDD